MIGLALPDFKDHDFWDECMNEVNTIPEKQREALEKLAKRLQHSQVLCDVCMCTRPADGADLLVTSYHVLLACADCKKDMVDGGYAAIAPTK